MKLIVGLGNPGKEYELTRHNVGFMVLEKIAEVLKVSLNKQKFNGIFGECNYNGEKILLVKPQTYMNLSGNCVKEVANFYKVNVEDIVIIYDDIDIEFGRIKIRPSGSPGTHNGMRNITEMLQTQKFPRVRVGTGRKREDEQLRDYVLSEFDKSEMETLEKSIETAGKAIIELLENGIQKAMNEFN